MHTELDTELSFCKNQIDSCIYNNFTHINEPLFVINGLV